MTGKIEQEIQQILAKDELIANVIGLAEPSTAAAGSDVQTFLGRTPFQETYKAVLKVFAPIIVEDLLGEYQDKLPDGFQEAGEDLIKFMVEGREAFEEEIGFFDNIGKEIDLMNHWKNRYGTKDGSGAYPNFMSRQKKTRALYGAFPWALARGMPGEAINCLEDIAQTQEKDTPASLISHFAPVLSAMRKLVENLPQDVHTKSTTGLRDILGGSSAINYITEMEAAMQKHGVYFEGEEIKLLPVLTG